jgi:hypothetical protein
MGVWVMDRQLQGKQLGDIIGGRYRLLSVLGSGGMSTVYLAEDLRLAGKRWAVKETRQTGQEQYEFLAEADMLVRLNHPNLPEIVDYYPADGLGFSYLVMDFIEGETLLQRFERQGKRMPVSQAVNYALQLCDVFHYLHSHKPEPIIYRDVKPANLMIDVQERIRLIDFGIARSFKAGQPADTVRIGTIGFAAPEQFEGRQTDARTDLFGMGALLYFLLSGGQYYYAARSSLREHDAALSVSLAGLVEKLLQAEPAARCQSAAEVRGELERVLAEQHQAPPGTAAASASTAAPGSSSADRTAAGPMQRQPHLPRVVAVGALYAGAGATFAALALARALHGLGVRHALLEAPQRQPELHALLFGEKHAPAGYRCYDETGEELRLGSAAWEDGCTLWLPASPLLPRALPHPQQETPGNRPWPTAAVPQRAAHLAEEYPPWAYGSQLPMAAGSGNGSGGGGSNDAAMPLASPSADSSHTGRWQLLLEELERPVIFIDVGSDWQSPAVQELIELASDFFYVVDPLLHKLESTAARRAILNGLRSCACPGSRFTASPTKPWRPIIPDNG